MRISDWSSDVCSSDLFEYAWETRWRLNEKFEPGFQAFGELGEVKNFNSPSDQEHKLGPSVSGRFGLGALPGKLKYDVAYLVGLTDATPDGTFKSIIEYEFRF